MDNKTIALLMGAAGAAGEKTYVEDVFSTYLYTGNGSTQTITNGIDLAGEGGLVWLKNRTGGSGPNALYDSTRSLSSYLLSESAVAASGYQPAIGSFNANGFNLISGAQGGNENTFNYASWTFRKAPKFFDVVTYTGTGTGTTQTINHSLGSVPGLIIIKRVDGTSPWIIWHRSLTSTYYLQFSTAAANDSSNTDYFGNNVTTVEPTSTTFTVGQASSVNSGDLVAYLFAHDAGGFGDSGTESVIKCGSYTGNGSTSGPIIDLGWEPQWLLVKQSSISGANWVLIDNMRGFTVDGVISNLYANVSAEEVQGVTRIAPFSTGFQPRFSGYEVNQSGQTYIYIAIRRGPMKTPEDATKVFSAVSQASRGTVTTGFPVDLTIFGDKPSTWGYNWSAQDRLRGKTGVLFTSATTAENTTAASAFDSNVAFTDGWVSGGTTAIYECFRRAPGFFDVVAYTGTGSARTVSHNLGVVPELMILKSRSDGGSWTVYSASLNLDQNLLLNSSAAASSGVDRWNNTRPTSSVFSLSTSSAVNASGTTYIAYLFATCPGVSKVGSYTGTGTTLDVDCGFASGARVVLIKRADSTGDWYVWDTARGIVSGNDPYLLLNSTAAEVTNTDYIDPLSSGFQISSTAPAAINANGGSFIFLAIA